MLKKSYLPLLLLFSLLLFQTVKAESTSFSGNQPGGLQITELTRQLEQKHQTRIFFLEEWFDGRRYDPQIADLPLPRALSRVIGELRLEVVVHDGMIFIMPSEGPQQQLSAPGDVVVIGNPNEFGRYSRATITGIITDGSTGELLFGAVLFDPESGIGASAGLNGRFSMELPVGEKRLRISYVGYEDRIQPIRLVSDGSIDLELFISSTQLQEVTIMAKRAEENVLRTQMSMISLDAKSIQELPGTFGERDIVRSITLLPGIQTVGEFGTGFNVRGGSADQNLILVENVPLFNSSHLFGLISVVNPDLVNNVTLIKAGTPAKFGERASSVMDIRLGNGLSTETASVTGGLGVLNSRILLQTPIIKEKASFEFGARTLYSDWFLGRIPSKDLMNSAAGFHDLTGVVNFAIGTKNRFTIFGYRSFDRFSFGGESDYEYANTMASFRWNSFFGPRLSSTFVAGISNYDYQVKEIPPQQEFRHLQMNSDIRYKTLKWQLTFLPGRNHKIETGLHAIEYGISPGRLVPLSEETVIKPKTQADERGLELAAFISDDITITEKISAELGLRYSHFLQLGPAMVNLYQEDLPMTPDHIADSVFYGKNDVVSQYGGLEPRIGLRFTTGETSSVKLSFSRINQYINLITNTSVMAPTDVWKLSDTYLRPLKSDQYALGYFRNFSENQIETSLEVYYKQLHNAIEYKSGAEIALNDYLETDIVNAKGYNYGLELYVKKNTGRLTGWTSYTYSASMRRSDSPYPDSQINNNAYFPSNYDRPHNFVLNTNYNISRRWRFGATFTYNTGRPVTLPELTYWQGGNMMVHFSDRNKYRLPDYHRLDLSISLGENLRTDRRGKGSWTFSVMNVYGRKNPYSVFYKKESGTFHSDTSFKLYQIYIIGQALPTITYNFRF